MWTWVTIAGGVALVLFGVRFLRKGLDRLFGPRLGQWVHQLTGHRLKAFISGLGVVVLAPSSTTVSILTVQAVQAGMASARQMLALLFGADLGLTMMVVLIALGAERGAPLLLVAGVILFQFTTLPRWRGIGQAALAVGFILQGVLMIKGGAAGLAGNADFVQLVSIAQRYPIGLAGMAMLMALAMQSSTATIGLVVGLAAASAVGLEVGVAVVAGANVGIVLTTLLVGWKQPESRRLALGNLMAKALVAALMLAFLPWVVKGLALLPGGTPRQVAYAHVGFNVALAVLCLPLVDVLDALTRKLVPQVGGGAERPFGPRYISAGGPESVGVALGQSRQEILRVAEIVREMLEDCWAALKNGDERLALATADRDDQVDLLDQEIKRFLTQLAGLDLDHAEATEQILQLRYLNELEAVGDVVDKNLTPLVVKKVHLGVTFSQPGWAELEDFHQKVAQNMLIAETAFSTRDRLLAEQLLTHKERIGQWEAELRDRHFQRLNAGLKQSHESSAIHLDALTHLKRINSCVSHVGYTILHETDAHRPVRHVQP
ncbi:MAG: Na/Pi cotransporter family protein [Phycisphaeraceae bacterium]|nr:Na/Pi cotransporter family protein [Phycisphaeraceae bacterium]